MRAQVEQYELERAQANQPDPAEVEQQWRDAYDQDPYATIQAAAQQAAQYAVQEYQKQTGEQTAQQIDTQNHLLAYTADKIVASRYNDWEEMKGQVAQMIQDDPDLLPPKAYTTPDETARALERVYKLVKAEAGYEAQQAAGNETDQGRQQKLAAQTMSGAAGRPDAPSNDEEWFAKVMGAAQQGYAARMAANGQ